VPPPPLHRSRRLPWDQLPNRLARARQEREARGLPVLDLTVTNPARAGFAYPEEELAEILRRAAAPAGDPHPLGLPAAREALAAALSSPADPVAPEDLVLTASTSESYSLLFKLFGDPGDAVLTTAPSYPLLDDLAALEGLALSHVPLAPGRGFALDPDLLEFFLTPRTCLLALIHPGNPSGTFLTKPEQSAAAALCAARGLPLVSDEVFADFALRDDPLRAGPAAASGEALALSLGGLSKSAGLPAWKLGWIRLGGPAALRREVRAGLEWISDSYLSVSGPVQRALPDLLAIAPRLRTALLDRVRTNLATLRAALANTPEVELLEPAAGWSAVLRVTLPRSDEDIALELLEREGVLVHPGYFFDFATDDYLVLSLLPEPGLFGEGVRRLARSAG
jgi:alanine-synthesizing transaminase